MLENLKEKLKGLRPGPPPLGRSKCYAIDELAEEVDPNDCNLMIYQPSSSKEWILIKNESRMFIPEEAYILKVQDTGVIELDLDPAEVVPLYIHKLLTEEEYENLSKEERENVKEVPENVYAIHPERAGGFDSLKEDTPMVKIKFRGTIPRYWYKTGWD